MATTENTTSTEIRKQSNKSKRNSSYYRKLESLPTDTKSLDAILSRISRDAAAEYLKIIAHDDEAPSETNKNDTAAAACNNEEDNIDLSYKDICELFEDDYELPPGLQHAQNLYCAQVSLAHYNTEHGTDYKLVECLTSGRCYAVGLRFHCNFKAAKPGKRPKLFFGDFRSCKAIVRNIQCYALHADKALYKCYQYCPPNLAHSHKAKITRRRIITEKEIRIVQDYNWAGYALQDYNIKHGTKYVVVEPKCIHSFHEDRFNIRFHCNFTAKLITSSDDESPVLFFADFVDSFLTKKFTECCIIDDAAADVLEDHCWFCPEGVLHPACYKTKTGPSWLPIQ